MKPKIFLNLAVFLFATVGSSIAQPVGTVVAYIGDPKTLTSEWAVCDGSSVKISENLGLFQVLGWDHGYGADSDRFTTFALPDLRGQFLRGVDNGSGRDKGASERKSSADANVIIGDIPGTIQSFATARPSDPFETATDGAHTHANGQFTRLMAHTGADTVHEKTDDNDAGSEAALHISGTMSAGTHHHKVELGGDAETRPINISVYWVIKIK